VEKEESSGEGGGRERIYSIVFRSSTAQTGGDRKAMKEGD